ncbi:MAG: LLM class flavin-dependent oxidoreductase, partial [Acidimicrobiia bacterium]|nr:LLM class flavin-dependent oxidoreductase [Acidimicrobiia bacterium]
GDRGRLLDHTLAVCQTLWRDAPARFDSDGLRFDRIHQFPHPVHPDGVPIWVSGTVNERVLQRIVRFGHGWIPWGSAAENLEQSLPVVHEALRAGGRAVDGFQVAGRLPVVTDDDGHLDIPRTMAGVPPLVDAGVTDFRAQLRLADERQAATQRLADVVAGFRSALGIGG